jgi:hypothetical protein
LASSKEAKVAVSKSPERAFADHGQGSEHDARLDNIDDRGPEPAFLPS